MIKEFPDLKSTACAPRSHRINHHVCTALTVRLDHPLRGSKQPRKPETIRTCRAARPYRNVSHASLPPHAKAQLIDEQTMINLNSFHLSRTALHSWGNQSSQRVSDWIFSATSAARRGIEFIPQRIWRWYKYSVKAASTWWLLRWSGSIGAIHPPVPYDLNNKAAR